MTKYFRISSYIRKPFLIYDFATAPFWISLYIRKIFFSLYQCDGLTKAFAIVPLRGPSNLEGGSMSDLSWYIKYIFNMKALLYIYRCEELQGGGEEGEEEWQHGVTQAV